MIFPVLKGYDAYITRGPDERDLDAETDERNARDCKRYHAKVDDEMTDEMERRGA